MVTVDKNLHKGEREIGSSHWTRDECDDSKFAVWEEEDSQIMSWLWNSMQPEIRRTCMFPPTAKEIWESVCQTYSKVRDASQIFDLKTKIYNTKQGTLSVTVTPRKAARIGKNKFPFLGPQIRVK